MELGPVKTSTLQVPNLVIRIGTCTVGDSNQLGLTDISVWVDLLFYSIGLAKEAKAKD